MKAVILNSGIGSRLGEYTKNKPKCMVKIQNDITILQYQLRLLEEIGVNEVIITTGYQVEVLSEYADSVAGEIIITYVHNSDYLTTNYIKSMDLIEDTTDDILLMHGDLVFEVEVLKQIAGYHKSCIVIDRGMELPEKDFKAKMDDDKVMAVGIHYFGPDCFTAQPLYKLLNADWKCWKQSIKTLCEEGNVKVYAEEALNRITDRIEIIGLDAAGRLCSEIDNEEDLNKIRNMLRNGVDIHE
ncbi:MAG TPA: sugar phosphate nucleotidyltransferase [Mobilitalea sp.]|nr:sugar phosphate nucleotidyltransferase [Mobilitalea sp.]